VTRQRFRWCGARWRGTALAAAATAVGAALLGTALIAAAPAQASGSGCANWTSPKPSGVYCFGVDGSGRQVSSTYGNYYFVGFTLHPALYDEREVVRFYDKKNVNYATFLEPAYPNWRFGNQNWTTDIHGTVRPGRACGSLQGDGKVLAIACQAIP
jgi:hypothetical protein